MKKFLISFFLGIFFSVFISAKSVIDFKIDLDNPWLGLTAIKFTYSDIAGDIFFDEQESDWCIKIRETNFYWAHGRLLKKENVKDWQKWHPFISYYYETTPENPKYYTKEFIQNLKPKNLIESRKNRDPPNYSFYKVVYQGNSKKTIIKQLREIEFLNRQVWVHKRIVEALKNVEKKILILEDTDKATRVFLENMGECWGFNWRVILDSGKLSNHSWGTAVDILPKVYGEKKIYWYWEAKKNNDWMLIPPEKRWSPPKKMIQAFKSEGFIWGGNWHIWDTMHFEYRPELIYISEFMAAKKLNSSPKKHKSMLKKTKQKGHEKKEFEPKGMLIPIFEACKKINLIKTITENYVNKKIDQIIFFKKELEAEEEATKELDTTSDDIEIP